MPARRRQVVARMQHGQHAQRRHLVHGVALRGGQLASPFGRLQRFVRAVQVRQRVGAAALRHAAEIGLAQRFGALRQPAEGVERRVVVALVQAQVAQVEQGVGIGARARHGRQDVQRFAQQVFGRGQAAQLAHGLGGMRLAGADAARPAGGARQVQRALHPFERRFVVVEAGETVADIDGGGDRAAQLAAFQRRFVALHVVAGGRAQVARRCAPASRGSRAPRRPAARAACRWRRRPGSGRPSAPGRLARRAIRPSAPWPRRPGWRASHRRRCALAAAAASSSASQRAWSPRSTAIEDSSQWASAQPAPSPCATQVACAAMARLSAASSAPCSQATSACTSCRRARACSSATAFQAGQRQQQIALPRSDELLWCNHAGASARTATAAAVRARRRATAAMRFPTALRHVRARTFPFKHSPRKQWRQPATGQAMVITL